MITISRLVHCLYLSVIIFIGAPNPGLPVLWLLRVPIVFLLVFYVYLLVVERESEARDTYRE